MTRQTVHKALDTTNASLRVTPRNSEIKIKIKTLNPEKGFLTGYSAHFQIKTLVTFSARNGIQVWYKHEGNCKNCEQLRTCKATLFAEVKDRNIAVPENHDEILPSDFAKTLFSRITGESE